MGPNPIPSPFAQISSLTSCSAYCPSHSLSRISICTLKVYLSFNEKGFRKAKQGTEHEYKRYKDLAEFKPFKYKDTFQKEVTMFHQAAALSRGLIWRTLNVQWGEIPWSWRRHQEAAEGLLENLPHHDGWL